MADKWNGLRTTRTCVPEITWFTPAGRMRAIQLTKRELLALIKDAAYALDKIEEAQEVQRRNRDRLTDDLGHQCRECTHDQEDE